MNSSTKSEVELRFNGLKAGEEAPSVAIYVLSPSGVVERKASVAKEGRLVIPRDLMQMKDRTFALGPDIEDLRALPKEMLERCRIDQLQAWEKTGHINFAKGTWSGWTGHSICLSGRVMRCVAPLPSIWDIPPVHPAGEEKHSVAPTAPAWYGFCAPVCGGVVEVYEQKCCGPRIIYVVISDVIRKLKDYLKVHPPFPPYPEPLPDPPVVFKRPLPDPPWIDKTLLRSIKESRSMAKGVVRITQSTTSYASTATAGVPHINLVEEIQKLQSLPHDAAVKYVLEAEHLLPFIRSCRHRKVGEAILGPGGNFTFCYHRLPMAKYLFMQCTYTYFYKVRQWQDDHWVYIYDGSKLLQYFKEDEKAYLRTMYGRACDPGPPDIELGDKPYVFLEYIGTIPSWKLVSPNQTGELKLATPPDNGGLVNPPPPGTSDEESDYNAPWGGTIGLRLRFSEGMQGLGAQYYRITILDAIEDLTSMADGNPRILLTPITWSKYAAGAAVVPKEHLGPEDPTKVNSQIGLYKIPYGTEWLWYQYHNFWPTTSPVFPDDRYIVMIEIFDAQGNRLKPTGAAGAGTAKDFTFRRWGTSDQTTPIPYATLLHLFWVDNKPAHADICELRQDGISSIEDCQYMVGSADSEFSVGFRAFHAREKYPTVPGTFMKDYYLWCHRGLSAASIFTEDGGTNQPGTLTAGPAAVSASYKFGDMLAIPGGSLPRCTFALNLRVRVKHTDGCDRLEEYDGYDVASVSVEKT